MKKSVVLALVVLLLGAATAMAQTPQKPAVPQQPGTHVGPNFVDANGDGICDFYQTGTRPGRQGTARGGFGPGDGTGNRGIGPKDGTGFGAGHGPGAAAGLCDGTGPKGPGRGRGPRR